MHDQSPWAAKEGGNSTDGEVSRQCSLVKQQSVPHLVVFVTSTLTNLVHLRGLYGQFQRGKTTADKVAK